MAEHQGNPIDTETTGDRVVMLTLNADGSVRQRNPQIIGDKDVALAAAKEQFRQQAVSAADRRLRGIGGVGTGEGSSEPDPVVQQVVDAHKAAEDKAESAAESAIDALHHSYAGTHAEGSVEGLSASSAQPQAAAAAPAAQQQPADTGSTSR